MLEQRAILNEMKAIPLWNVRLCVTHRPFTAEAAFNPKVVHVGFVVDGVAVGKFFSPSSTAFLCQCSTPIRHHGLAVCGSTSCQSYQQTEQCCYSTETVVPPERRAMMRPAFARTSPLQNYFIPNTLNWVQRLVVTAPKCIREGLSSNLDQNTGYTDAGLTSFSSFLEGKYRTVLQLSQDHFHTNSFQFITNNLNHCLTLYKLWY
jgi:hypothetical protein